MGHLCSSGLEVLSKEGLIMGGKMEEVPFCGACAKEKTMKVNFSSTSHNTSRILDCVHLGLCGPISTKSLGGASYFFILVDEYSRRVWVYPLRRKEDAYMRFVDWQHMVKKQSGRRIKSLVGEMGIEFCSNQFMKFCASEGVEWLDGAALYSSQQVGVVEGMIGTLLDKVKSMLCSSGFCKELWAEVLSTAAYILNRSPCATIMMKTPMELWSGTKPNLSHMKVFGCAVQTHQEEEGVEAKALEGVLLGYMNDMKSYRLWCLENGKGRLVISRNDNVKFQEDEVPLAKLYLCKPRKFAKISRKLKCCTTFGEMLEEGGSLE